MSWFRKKTKIVAYGLISKEIKNKFLTITKDANGALEYSMLVLKLKHLDHFLMWCDARQLDKGDIKNWLNYYENCVPNSDKEEFKIVRVTYELDNVLAILRMFGNCFPIGCSFDTEVERTYFKSIVDDAQKQLKAEKAAAEKTKEEDNSNGNK